jgi:hypothetical protein
MARGVKHSDSAKSQALALILSGETVSEAARILDLPQRTVHEWYSELPSSDFAKIRLIQRERAEEIALSHVRVLFGSMDNVAGQLGDRDYLKRFPPSQVADAYDKLRIGVASVLSTILATAPSDSGDSEPEEADDIPEEGQKPKIVREPYDDNDSTSPPSRSTAED